MRISLGQPSGAWRLFLLSDLLLSLAWASSDVPAVKRSIEDLDASYDFVVMGGGTSGLTVADRLSEDSSRTVLVIEFGYIDDSPLVLRPSTGAMSAANMFNITSLPVRALNNRTGTVAAAAVVGGGSAVNAMYFDRGSSEDYDNWAALGNPGWDWNGLLPYFRKSANLTLPNENITKEFGIFDEPRYYDNGPVQASYSPWQWPTQKVQWKAWEELGIPVSKNASGGGAVGVYWVPSSQDPVTQTRSYARTAHHACAERRPNYHLLVGHEVLNISLSADRRANGVTFQSRETGKISSVAAKRECILATGGAHSPVILQRSGIGPCDLLKSANVECKVDLPGVGQNAQDHPNFLLPHTYEKNLTPNPGWVSPANPTFNKTFYDSAEAQYKQNKTGPLTIAMSNNSPAFLALPMIADDWSDIIKEMKAQDPKAYLPAGTSAAAINGFTKQLEILTKSFASMKTAVLEALFKSDPTLVLFLQKPLSRGRVSLNTTDPYANPVVDLNALANPIDSRVMLAAVSITRKWYNTKVHQQLQPVESAATANVTSAAALENLFKQSVTPSSAHLSGTCSMMPEELGGVVGSDLLVHKMSGLSVVDGSIIPMIPATHLCATIYAIAEKAADIIKQRNA